MVTSLNWRRSTSVMRFTLSALSRLVVMDTWLAISIAVRYFSHLMEDSLA